MDSAPTLPFVPVEEYLRTSYEPNCEYLDGVLKPKALPDRIHSRLQALIVALLLSRQDKYSLDCLPELHARITPTRFRIPDVCAMTKRAASSQYADADSPPLFTIEIVSRGEAWTDLRSKLSDHLAIGVQTVIIADPHGKTLLKATQSEPLREIRPPLIVDVDVPGAGILSIDFDDLYRQL